MQRAVNDQQKEERRRAILDAALRLFDATDYSEVSMSAVAEEAGIAKGTVYLYFDTKEELFLELQEEAFTAWFEDVATALESPPPEQGDLDAVVDLLTTSLEERPTLVRLIAVLHTVLEHNIDLETATRFKRTLLRGTQRVAPLLEEVLPFLSEGDGVTVLLRLHALVIGFQHMADPTPVAAEALEHPDLAPLRVDFHSSLDDTLRTLLLGLKHR